MFVTSSNYMYGYKLILIEEHCVVNIITHVKGRNCAKKVKSSRKQTSGLKEIVENECDC